MYSIYDIYARSENPAPTLDPRPLAADWFQSKFLHLSPQIRWTMTTRDFHVVRDFHVGSYTYTEIYMYRSMLPERFLNPTTKIYTAAVNESTVHCTPHFHHISLQSRQDHPQTPLTLKDTQGMLVGVQGQEIPKKRKNWDNPEHLPIGSLVHDVFDSMIGMGGSEHVEHLTHLVMSLATCALRYIR